MRASTRGLAHLVGRCLILRPAPSPPLYPSTFLTGLLSGLPRFLPLQGIENASPSRPLVAPLLTTLFLVDLYASSSEAQTWKIGRGDNTKRPMKEMPRRRLLSHSEGGAATVREQAERLKTALVISGPD